MSSSMSVTTPSQVVMSRDGGAEIRSKGEVHFIQSPKASGSNKGKTRFYASLGELDVMIRGQVINNDPCSCDGSQNSEWSIYPRESLLDLKLTEQSTTCCCCCDGQVHLPIVLSRLPIGPHIDVPSSPHSCVDIQLLCA